MAVVQGGYDEWAAAGKPSSGAPQKTTPAFDKIAAKSTKKSKTTGKSPQDTAIESFMAGVHKKAQQYFDAAIRTQAANDNKAAAEKQKKAEADFKALHDTPAEASSQQSKQWDALVAKLTSDQNLGIQNQYNAPPSGTVNGMVQKKPLEVPSEDSGVSFGLAGKIAGVGLKVLQAPQSAVVSAAEQVAGLGVKAVTAVTGNSASLPGSGIPGLDPQRGIGPSQLWEDIKNGRSPSQQFYQQIDYMKAHGENVGILTNPFFRIPTSITADVLTDPIVYAQPEAALARLGKAGVATEAALRGAEASKAASALREGLVVPGEASSAAMAGVDALSQVRKAGIEGLNTAENLQRAGRATAAGLRPSDAALEAAKTLEQRALRFQSLAMKAGRGRLGAGLTRAELEEVTAGMKGAGGFAVNAPRSGGIAFNAPGTGWIGRKLGIAKLIAGGSEADKALVAAREPLQAIIMGRNAFTAAPGRVIEALATAANRTKLFRAVGNALGGAEPELRKLKDTFRTTGDPQRFAESLLGIQAKRAGRLTSAGLERETVNTFKQALKPIHGKVEDATIVQAWRGDPNAIAAVRAAVPDQAVADRALGVWNEVRNQVNSRAGFEMIPERANYAPRLVKTPEGDTILPEFGKVFNKAGIEKQAVKPGMEFYGVKIGAPEVTGKTVEQQMFEALHGLGGGVKTELSNNLPEMVSYWTRNAARRVGEEHARDLMVQWDVAKDGIRYVANGAKLRLTSQRDTAEAALAGLHTQRLALQDTLDELTGAKAAKAAGARATHLEGVVQNLKAHADSLDQLVKATEERLALTNAMVEGRSQQYAVAQAAVDKTKREIQQLQAERDALISAHGMTSDVAAAQVMPGFDQKMADLGKQYHELVNNPIVVQENMHAIVNGEKESQFVKAVLASNDPEYVRRVLDSMPDSVRIRFGSANPRLALSQYADQLDQGVADSISQLRAAGSPVPSQAEAENLRKWLPNFRQQVSDAANAVATTDFTNVDEYNAALQNLATKAEQSNRAHMAMELYDMGTRRLAADDVLAQDRVLKATMGMSGVMDMMAGRQQVIHDLIQNPDVYVNADLQRVTDTFDKAWLSFRPKVFDAYVDAVGAPPHIVQHLEDAKAYAASFNVPLSDAFDAALMRGSKGGPIDIGAYRAAKESVAAAVGVPVEQVGPLFAGQVIREMFGEKPLLLQARELERELGFRSTRVTNQWDKLIDAHADQALAHSDLQNLYEVAQAPGVAAEKRIEAAKYADVAVQYRNMEKQLWDQAGLIDLKNPNWISLAAERASLESKLNQFDVAIEKQNQTLSDAIDGLAKVGSQQDGAWRLAHTAGMDQFGAIYWNARDPMRATVADSQLADALASSSKMVGANSEFLKYWNGVTQFWKRYAILYPGFTIRNIMGGIYNNWLAGVSQGAWGDFHDAYKAWNRAAVGKPEEWTKFAEANPQLSKFYEQWVQAGGVSGGQTAYEIAGQHLFPGPGRVINPFSQDFAPVQGMRKFNTWAEDHIRGSQAWDSMMKEWDVAAGDFAPNAMQRAIARVDKFQFDYGDLSPFEQGVLRRTLIPFYTWSRKNMPLQFEMFAMNPSKATRYFRIKQEIEKQSTPDPFEASYLTDPFSMRLPISTTDGAGHVYYLPDLPNRDIFQAGDWRYWYGHINPYIKGPIDLAAGQRVESQIPISETFKQAPDAWTRVPGLMQALSLLPGTTGAKQGKDGNWYMTDRTGFVVENLLPVLGRLRRQVPSESKYQTRAMTSWLSFVGLSLRSNDQTEQDITKSVLDKQKKDAKSAQNRLPDALKP